jgi:hypothetical protein
MPSPGKPIEIVAQLFISDRDITGCGNAPGSHGINEIKTESATDQIHRTSRPSV